MKKHIPNLFTALNLLSGCVAVLMTVYEQYIVASGFVFLGIFFDFFDGVLARKLSVQSELGVQLDSLADMVTSGLVPGIMMYGLIDEALGGRQYFCNAGRMGSTCVLERGNHKTSCFNRIFNYGRVGISTSKVQY